MTKANLKRIIDGSIICDDGTVSLVFHSTELDKMIGTLKKSMDLDLSASGQRGINKVIKMLSHNSQAFHRRSIKKIKESFNRGTYKKISYSKDKEKHRGEAFNAYYTYFVGMKPIRIALLQKSTHDIIVLIYDKNLIYRFNLMALYNYRSWSRDYTGKFEISGLWVYDIDCENIRRPLFKFDNDNCDKFKLINKSLVSQIEVYVDEAKESLGEEGLSRNKMTTEKTPPINDIFKTLKEVDEKYIYFQYGKKVKCSSDYLLITLRML